MAKYSRLASKLAGGSVSQLLQWHKPPLPKAAIFANAHDPAYVQQVMDTRVPKAIEKKIGFEVTSAVAKRALLATSGTLLAAELALQHGIAGNLAGGSHHAKFHHGEGFCTFNDVGVAAIHLLKTGKIQSALVLDLDVHQGDGTAEILANYPSLITTSIHCGDNYPFEKKQSNIDIALAAGTANHLYLKTLSALLARLSNYSKPDIIFYNAGVDIHVDDRLGKFNLNNEGILARERMVLEWCKSQAIAVCIVIGGGYSRNIDALAARHTVIFEVATSIYAD